MDFFCLFHIFRRDLAVRDEELADTGGTGFGIFARAVVLFAVARVIDCVILTVNLDHAVVSDTLLKFVAEHNGLEFAAVGDLFVFDLRQILLVCFRAGVADVIGE